MKPHHALASHRPKVFETCQACGVVNDIDDLDGKPTLSLWLRTVRLFRGQPFMLRYATDHGYEFDRIECAKCYGPGYTTLSENGGGK